MAIVMMMMVMVMVVVIIMMIHALLEMYVNKTFCRTEADIELIIDDEHISRWVVFTKWCEDFWLNRKTIFLFPLLVHIRDTNFLAQ